MNLAGVVSALLMITIVFSFFLTLINFCDFFMIPNKEIYNVMTQSSPDFFHNALIIQKTLKYCDFLVGFSPFLEIKQLHKPYLDLGISKVVTYSSNFCKKGYSPHRTICYLMLISAGDPCQCTYIMNLRGEKSL